MTTHIKHVLIGLIIASVLLLGAWKYFAYAGGLAHDQKVLAEEKMANDLKLAQAQAAASASAQADFNQKLSASNAAVKQLAAEVQKLQADLSARQKADADLGPADLAGRWQSLIGKGVVQPATSGLSVDLPAAHETVSELEEVPVLTAENGQLRASSLQKDLVIVAGQVLVAAKQTELDTCKRVTADADAVCTAKLKEQAATARKHTIWWAVGSFIGGLIAGRRI